MKTKKNFYDFIIIIMTLIILTYGSFLSKNVMDGAKEKNFQKNFLATFTSKIITRLLMLNDKEAISQFYQFKMISYYSNFQMPVVCHVCTGDHIGKKIKSIISKHLLTNLNDFFDINRFYKYFELTLEFDPNNYFARMFGVHLSKNHIMMQNALNVLTKTYHKFPKWEYAFEIGWQYFYCIRNYDKARFWFKEVKKFKTAKKIALNMYQATFIFEKKYDQAIIATKDQLNKIKDESIKAQLTKKLLWYKSLSHLYKQAAKFKKSFGRNINNLEELIKHGYISKIPTDTIGTGFYWDTDNKEPSSYDNPFDQIKKRNPIDTNQMVIDEENDHSNHHQNKDEQKNHIHTKNCKH